MAYLRRMAQASDLFPVNIAESELDEYSVTDAGWYAVDDAEKIVLGPFVSLEECERAIRERSRPPG
jgi:hypothetical protein